jgi:hypothetical protein
MTTLVINCKSENRMNIERQTEREKEKELFVAPPANCSLFCLKITSTVRVLQRYSLVPPSPPVECPVERWLLGQFSDSSLVLHHQ